MTQRTSHPGRHMLEGSIRNFLAEALFPLTALVTASFLTRRLGPDGYGLLVLAVTLVVLIEWSLNSIFSRATIKHVGEAKDWHPVGTASANLQMTVGCVAMLAVWLLAFPLSRLLNEPGLAWYLCLLALDIPLFSLTQAHRHILIGLGSYGACAFASAGRWIARLILIVLLVELGLSIHGAILGIVGSSLVELMIARRFVRPVLFRRVSLSEWPLWDYAVPLFLSAASVNCYARLDLFVLKALGGTAAQAGLYGAAQNLSLLPGLFGLALLPLLLSTLSRVLSRGDVGMAKDLSLNATRASLVLLPLGAVIAGMSGEIVSFFFGESFEGAAPILAILIFGSVAVVIMAVATTILIAIGQPRVTLVLTAPLVPLALLGHLIAIPRWGSVGAATVTMVLAIMGAVLAVWAVSRLWDLVPPGRTVWRSLVVAGLAYGLGMLWPVTGAWVVMKLVVAGILVLVAYWGLGEWSTEEMALGRSLLKMRIVPVHHPTGN